LIPKGKAIRWLVPRETRLLPLIEPPNWSARVSIQNCVIEKDVGSALKAWKAVLADEPYSLIVILLLPLSVES
jgi:hypothetical protein